MDKMIKTWMDSVVSAVPDEDTALELVAALGYKYGWVTGVTTLGDVSVSDEAGESHYDITEAEKLAVRETYTWDRYMAEAMAAAAANAAPAILRKDDGTFEVLTDW
jgi:hypothetical protein